MGNLYIPSDIEERYIDAHGSDYKAAMLDAVKAAAPEETDD